MSFTALAKPEMMSAEATISSRRDQPGTATLENTGHDAPSLVLP
jgi:hypothetical protein